MCESPRSYTADGICFPINEQSDLFFAGEKHEGWINVYRDESCSHYAGDIFNSKDEALAIAEGYNYVSTIKIEWEE